MRAAIRKIYGMPELIGIEDIPKPSPNAQEVLVRVHTTTVNRTDCANLRAKPFIMRFFLGLFKPRNVVLGTDFAGEIAMVGADVKSFKKHDRVFGFVDLGALSQAEYMVVSETDLFLIPESINYQQAAASLEGAHYAHAFVHRVSFKPGQSILINGATGAIGSALLQLVKLFEVTITATCNTENIHLISELGANNVIDYTQEDFTRSSEKYDFIFDAVGKSTYRKCKPLLKDKGVYISSELGAFAQNLFLSVLPSISGKQVVFPVPYKTQKTIPYINELLASGRFDPVIDSTYSLDDIAMAYEYVLSGRKTGNVLINMLSFDR